jgi:two-component system, OmpR family, sensor histidine kinase KdpD
MSASPPSILVTPGSQRSSSQLSASHVTTRHYVAAAVACMVTTAIAAPLSRNLDLANVVMLYPLAVLLVAFRLGRGPAVLAAFLSVALFDFFLVPPYYTFAVADVQYLLTFAVMLAVALITGHLTARLREHAEAASWREARTRSLYEMARGLAGAHTIDQVDKVIRACVSQVAGANAVMLLCDEHGELAPVSGGDIQSPVDHQMAKLACATSFTDVDAPQAVRYEPMKTPKGVHGVLAFFSPNAGSTQLGEHGELLEAVASLAAISIERVQYAETARRDQSQPVAQRLGRAFSSLLSGELVAAANTVETLQKVVESAQSEAILPKEWASVELRRKLVDLNTAIGRVRQAAQSSDEFP